MSQNHVSTENEEQKKKALHLTHDVRERCKDSGLTTDMAGCHHEPAVNEPHRFVGDE
jgi:hypothetical protein